MDEMSDASSENNYHNIRHDNDSLDHEEEVYQAHHNDDSDDEM